MINCNEARPRADRETSYKTDRETEKRANSEACVMSEDGQHLQVNGGNYRQEGDRMIAELSGADSPNSASPGFRRLRRAPDRF